MIDVDVPEAIDRIAMVPSLAWLLTRRWVTAALICSLTIFFILLNRESIIDSSRFKFYASTIPHDDLLSQQGQFWQLFSEDLDLYAPHILPLIHPEDTHLDIGYDESDHRARPDLLVMSANQLNAMKKQHFSFVERLQTKEYSLPYSAGSRGIVTTAGGPYLPVALVSIRMIRETGSELPVEVFLSNWNEWDPVICSKILPSLNAKCVVLQDIFDYGNPSRKTKLDKYQYKIMSILFSSFEEILFLDSDCFPIRNPDQLFKSEPFTSNGLVLWPDFWFPSESPKFFEIADIQAPALSDRSSTEAGELLYSKRKHELSILLAAYYNYYGPKFYYPLQSQGAPGEGDKETFLWSAVALGAPFYTVKSSVQAVGYTTKAGEWRGSAMAQFDPIQDYESRFEEADDRTPTNTTYPRPFFAHVNFPKLNPGQIFDSSSFGISGPTQDSDGHMRRIWHENAENANAFFGFDVEKTVWSVVRDIACEYEDTIASWQDKTDICKKAEEYWNAVFGQQT